MGDNDKKYGLLAELARRRVFRSVGAYIVVSWVVVQVGATVFPEFGVVIHMVVQIDIFC